MFVCLQQKAGRHYSIKIANKSFESVANFKHGLIEKIQLQLWCKTVGHSAFGLLWTKRSLLNI